MKEINTQEEIEERKKRFTMFLKVQTIGVVNLELIKNFMIENKLYFSVFCHKCGVGYAKYFV